MSKERELLQRALYLLECVCTTPLLGQIKELLAQPETITPREGLAEFKKGYARAELDLKREPLSKEEIENICKDHFWVASLIALVRAIEKAHGIGDRDE